MTEVTNDLPDVAQFLFSQNEMAECLSYENVIQSSDDFLFEDIEPNVAKTSNPKETFHLMDQDLSINTGEIVAHRSNCTLSDTSSIVSYESVSSDSPFSCNSPSMPQLITKEDGLQAQQVIRNSNYNASSPTVSNSNELVYENLSLVVRLIYIFSSSIFQLLIFHI